MEKLLRQALIVAAILICSMINIVFAGDELVGVWSFDEGSGVTANDASGNSNDGSLINTDATIWIVGKTGYGLSLDGTDDYVNCGNADALNCTENNEFTISCWIRPTTLSKSQGIIGKYSSFAASPYSILMLSDGRCEIVIGNGTNYGLIYISSSYFTVGQWTHLVITYDGSVLKGYVNGTLRASQQFDYTLSANSADLLIGKHSSCYFEGDIDKVKLYNYALSTNELTELGNDFLCGSWEMDEGSGTTIDDSTDNGNDGTLYGGTGWTTGKYNKALSFDGVDDYVSCGNDSIFNFNDTNQFTISCWIKPATLSKTQGIIGKRTQFYLSPYSIFMLSDGRCEIVIGNGTNYGLIYLPANCFSVDEWIHLVVTYDGSMLRGYVNGKEQASNQLDFTLASNTTELVIGKFVANYFEGNIDKVKLYSRALHANEIKIMCDGLRGSWEMNQGTGTLARDSSGNANDGTLTNMSSPWVGGHLDNDGYFRYALTFDGTNDYVNCGNDSIFNFSDTNAFTISCWVRPATLSKNQGIVGKYSNFTSSPFNFFFISDGRLEIVVGNGTSYNTLFIPASCFTVDEWSHITVTYNGSMLRCYVNGYEEGSKKVDYTLAPNSADLLIGKHASCYFEGDIDKVRLYDRPLSTDEISTMHLLSVLPPNRNYYTGENVVAACVLNISDDTGLTNCYLVAKDSNGNSLGTNNSPETETDLTYSTSSLSSGTNTITVELRKNSGERVFATDFEILKRTALTGEVKIDYDRGIILRNNSEFFPIGMYLSYTPVVTESFQDMANAGFNTVIHWKNSGLDPEDAETYVDDADDYGLLVVDRHAAYCTVWLGEYTTSATDFWEAYKGLGDSPIDVDQSERIIDACSYVKQKSNLLAYYSFDEPTVPEIEPGQDLYGEINDEDGYHPVVVNHIVNTIDTLMEDDDYTNWSDIVCFDPYWIPPYNGSLNTSVNWVAKYTCKFKELAKQKDKVLWVALMAEMWGRTNKRVATPAEHRSQAFLSVIHGAKGIFYYQYPVLHDDTWTALSELAEDLDDLAPSLLTPDLEQTINYSVWDDTEEEYLSATCDPANDQFTDVQISLREAPSGASYDYVLLAANTQRYPVDVDFTISLLGSSGTVSRLFDTDTYTVTSGKFFDQIEGHGTRAYTFTSTSTAAITINADLEARTDLEPAAESAPYDFTGRISCTNLFQNPSLENNFIPNWPDYCRPIRSVPRINTQNQQWGLVTDSPYHGSKCLKIDGSGTNGFSFSLIPEHSGPGDKDYTFSLYMKDDIGGRQVQIGCDKGGYDTVTLTTSWARYDYTCSFPANYSQTVDNHRFNIKLFGGTIWVDAVQVEQASGPTAFTTN